MMKHMRNSTKDNESDMQGYCFGMNDTVCFLRISPN